MKTKIIFNCSNHRAIKYPILADSDLIISLISADIQYSRAILHIPILLPQCHISHSELEMQASIFSMDCEKSALF